LLVCCIQIQQHVSSHHNAKKKKNRKDAWSLQRAMVTTSENILAIAELGGLIMNRLALSALTALSFTSKTNYLHVQHYMSNKLKTIFGPFELPLHEVQWKLKQTDGIIIGSAALRAVAPAEFPVTIDSIEIVVLGHGLAAFEDWLTTSCGYRQKATNFDKNEHACTGLVQSCHSFVNDRDLEINVLVVETSNRLYEVVFHSSNTANMNMITCHGLFTAYRSLLNRGLAARNRVTNMLTMVIVSASSRHRQQMLGEEMCFKTMSDGFTFLQSDASPHPLHTCRCEQRSICPLTMRNTNDSMCSFMRVLRIEERVAVNAGTMNIPTINHRLPNIVWCRADKMGLGFALCMTCDRISRISRENLDVI
jgi:hypothetical protein